MAILKALERSLFFNKRRENYADKDYLDRYICHYQGKYCAIIASLSSFSLDFTLAADVMEYQREHTYFDDQVISASEQQNIFLS